MTLINPSTVQQPLTIKLALVVTGSIARNSQQVPELLSWLAKNCQYNVIYFAGNLQEPSSAQERAKVFLQFALDDSVDAIVVLRGGEGSADVIPYLHEQVHELKQARPKRLLGFSDFTSMLLYFHQTYAWPCIHGIGALRMMDLAMEPISLEATHYLLQGQASARILPLTPLNDQARDMLSPLTGQLTGGNLSVINISLKETWEIDCSEKIVLLEDVGEKPHVVSRTLKHLQRVGTLTQARAVILGDFLTEPVGCDESSQAANAGSITRTLQFYADQVAKVPVFKTDFIGHGKKNYPFKLGEMATLVGGNDAYLAMG